MKNRICLILALLMLVGVLGGCANKSKDAAVVAPVETPAPIEKTPEPAPEPTSRIIQMQEIPKTPKPETEGETDGGCADCRGGEAAHKNTDEEIMAVAKDFGEWYIKGGFDLEKHGDAFLYAKLCTKDDWHNPSTTINQWLYTDVPYNIFIEDMGDKPSQFMTNKELVEQIGQEKADYYTYMAAMFCDMTASNYPKDMNMDTLTKQFLDCGLPEEKAAQYAKEKLDYYNAHEFTREAWINWTESLIYRSANGYLRVRALYNAVVRKASKEFLEDKGMPKSEVGKWVAMPVEIVIRTDEDGDILDMAQLNLGDPQFCTEKSTKILEGWLKG